MRLMNLQFIDSGNSCPTKKERSEEAKEKKGEKRNN